jgi:hypothetical protein
MSGYQVALFFHLLALLSAIGASTIEHVSMAEVRDAPTGREALRRLGLAHAFSRVFPVALAVLVGTGAWMVHDDWSWSAPFVLAGIAGSVFLLVTGAGVLGPRAGRVAAALAAAPDERVPDLVRDPVWWCVSWGDTGVAIGVVLAMTARPGAAASALCVAGGLGVGVLVGLLSRRAPVAAVQVEGSGS